MPKLRDALTKVYDLCKSRGFVFERSLNLRGEPSVYTALDYGPLGIEMKQNLMKEWWHEMVTSRDNVYGLDLSMTHLRKQSVEQEADGTHVNRHLSSYFVDTYRYACELIKTHGKQSTVGLAQSLNISHQANPSINEFMFRYVDYLCEPFTLSI